MNVGFEAFRPVRPRRDDALHGVGGVVTSGTHEIGVQPVGRLANLLVGEFVKSLLRGDDLAVVVALEGAVSDQLGGLSEPLGGALEVVPPIVGDRELDDDGTSDHSPYTELCV